MGLSRAIRWGCRQHPDPASWASSSWSRGPYVPGHPCGLLSTDQPRRSCAGRSTPSSSNRGLGRNSAALLRSRNGDQQQVGIHPTWIRAPTTRVGSGEWRSLTRDPVLGRWPNCWPTGSHRRARRGFPRGEGEPSHHGLRCPDKQESLVRVHVGRSREPSGSDPSSRSFLALRWSAWTRRPRLVR